MRLSIARLRRRERDTPQPPKTLPQQALELVVIVVVALGLAFLVQAFLVKPYKIPSPSMEPTLNVGQRVLVNRIGTHFGNPHVGDIVVFHPPMGADTQPGVCGDPSKGDPSGGGAPCGMHTPDQSSDTFIKRIVAVGGDTLRIRDGHAIVNGRRQADAFSNPCTGGGTCTYPRAIRVPAGEYFMMGDNRGDSDDSRYWGPVPKSWIIGGAFFTYWPLDRIGGL